MQFSTRWGAWVVLALFVPLLLLSMVSSPLASFSLLKVFSAVVVVLAARRVLKK